MKQSQWEIDVKIRKEEVSRWKEKPKCEKRKCSYRLGQLTGLLRWVDDLVVEDGEVKSEAEADGMSRLHFVVADFQGLLVGFLWVVDDGLGQNKQKEDV